MKYALPAFSIPRFIAPLLLAAMPSLLPAQQIGFVEKYALAADRDAVLKELVPGTEEYYYYHALHYQNQGKKAEMEAIIKEWNERFTGTRPHREEILNRQVLLDYAKDPQKALETLRNKLAITYNHQRITPDARPDLATKLDPALISWDAFLSQALQSTDAFANITDAGLTALLREGKVELTIPRRRELLSRLQRPDFPKLVDIVNADLGTKESGGFGEFKVHSLLTLPQLEDLLKLRPALLQNSNFVTAWAGKLRPAFGQDAERDPAVREAWLDRLQAFVNRLGPGFNSLKAHVLYHRLYHDRSRGIVDEAKLLAYLQLPRPVPYLNEEWRKVALTKNPVDLNADFSSLTSSRPIGNDELLVRDLLLRVLAKAENAEKFLPYVNDQWINAILAEAKLTSGADDAQRWISLLPPESYQTLKDRTDLDFEAASRESFNPEDDVSLDLYVKNVPRLLVKVFEINTENVHRNTGAQVNTDLNLDGLTANSEQSYDYNDAPLLRAKRSFPFPQLKGKRGVWVVEFIGGGKSSRALIRKGSLRHLAQPAIAGTRITVIDEKLKPVPRAWVLLGTRRFEGDENGEILVPFSTQPGSQNVILGDSSGFTSLEQIDIAGEAWQLTAGFHVPQESLLPGASAKLAVRPALLLNGRPRAVGALENVRLTINSTNLEGVPSSAVYPLAKLEANAETVVEFSVPERLSTLSFTLEGDMKSFITAQPVHLNAAGSLKVNGITLTDVVGDIYLSSENGLWVLHELGRNGEPRPERETVVTFARPEFTQTISATFKTDAEGAMMLGKLDGISRIDVKSAAGVQRSFMLPHTRASLPAVVNAAFGEPVQFAWRSDSGVAPGDVSVLEMRNGTPVYDLSAAAEVKDGFVILNNLNPGEYAVEFVPAGERTIVRVGGGDLVAGHLVSAGLTMELSNSAPLAISGIAVGDATVRDKNEKKQVIVFHIGNPSVETRVHVFASRYLPQFDAFSALGEDHLGAPFAGSPAWRPSLYQSARTIGEEYRYVLERKAAKHFPGNLLPKPGLLLNPWAISDTKTEKKNAARGEDAAAMTPERPAAPATPPPAAKPAEQNAQAAISMEPDLSFLGLPAPVALNLRPDKDGNVVLDLAALGDRQFIRIVAVDSDSAATRDFSLQAPKLQLRERRLTDALDPKQHYSRQDNITLLEKDVPFAFKDARTATFQVAGDLAAAFSLLQNLSGNPSLAEFSWLKEWPKLDPAKRAELYSKYASHELHFFLARKDPEFFKSIVQPYLASKRDKTFMDHYLLGADMSGYLRPWQYSQLNTVERILLARRVESERPIVSRLLKDWLDTQPQDRQRDAFLFETALRGRSLSRNSAADYGIAWKEGLLPESETAAGDRAAPADDYATLTLGFAVDGATELRRKNANKWGYNMFQGAGGADTHGTSVTGALGLQVEDSVEFSPVELKQQVAKLTEDGRKTGDKADRGRAWRRDSEEKELEDLVKAKAASPKGFFRQMEKTKEWAENNYYHLLIAQQNADLVMPNRFWRDYALWDGAKPFVSPHLAEAAGSFTEIVLALAALDVPFPPADPAAKLVKVERKDNAVTLTPSGRGLLFHQEIRTAEPDKEGAQLLVSQNFYRQGDRYIEQAGEKTDKFVTGEFVAGIVYGSQIVVTNPSSSRQKLDLLFQIPEGAIPVLKTRATQNVPIMLEPYHTGTFDFQFYFPAPGQFTHYPVHLSRNAKTAASAQAVTFNVVGKPSQADKASWEYVSQNADPAEVINFLDQHNLFTLNLDLMAWRLKDADFFRKAFTLLRTRHMWHPVTWSYALMHNVPEGVTDYLMHSGGFLAQCGAYIDTPAIKIDPVERRIYQHLEYSPVVNARAHRLGGQRTILNDKMRGQYLSLMKILTYRPQLDQEDTLAVTYYLALQDRIEEAVAFFAKVDPAKIAERLQYDYLQAWLAMCQEDTATARRIATAHAKHGVDRWRNLFTEMTSQLDEIEGRKPAVPRPEDRDATQDALAAKEPACNIRIESRMVKLDFRNLTEVTVNYYPMDLEFLFSANPFVTQDTSRFRMIRPNRSEKVMLPANTNSHVFALPAEYQSANVLVEITGGGLTKAEAAYANELDVQVSEGFGRLEVRHATDKRPLTKVYVKVFADQNGTPVFYKDGYTDLRGKFDYASLSTGDLDSTTRFSVLIMSDDFGATVKELQPPKR
ncbi:MAG TPA: hypothetical protein VG796_16350 [Verrucomicrobiales bacterium]|nr:hypothetical protein [Verrucomicrobiales bacterium]